MHLIQIKTSRSDFFFIFNQVYEISVTSQGQQTTCSHRFVQLAAFSQMLLHMCIDLQFHPSSYSDFLELFESLKKVSLSLCLCPCLSVSLSRSLRVSLSISLLPLALMLSLEILLRLLPSVFFLCFTLFSNDVTALQRCEVSQVPLQIALWSPLIGRRA